MLSHPWVAMIALLGPLAAIDYTLPDNGAPPTLSAELETLWHMTAMYTAPTHRSKGLGKAVIAAALAHTISQSRGKQQTRTRIFVSPYNMPVLKLYEKLDFKMAGMASLAEGLRANGDQIHLPPEGSEELASERYSKRIGYAMERICEVV